MVGPMVELPEDQQTPEARVDRYFQLLGKDKNTDKLDLNDFKIGSTRFRNSCGAKLLSGFGIESHINNTRGIRSIHVFD